MKQFSCRLSIFKFVAPKVDTSSICYPSFGFIICEYTSNVPSTVPFYFQHSKIVCMLSALKITLNSIPSMLLLTGWNCTYGSLFSLCFFGIGCHFAAPSCSCLHACVLLLHRNGIFFCLLLCCFTMVVCKSFTLLNDHDVLLHLKSMMQVLW